MPENKYYKQCELSYWEIKRRSEDPFSDDLLNISDIANTIAQILSNTQGPFVFNINSPYGTGKTFFINRLRVLLERKFNANTVLYNAWESDFYQRPLISIITELNTLFNDPKEKVNFTKVTDIAKKLFSYVDNVGIGIPNGPSVSINFKHLEENNNTYNIIENYGKLKNAKNEFIQCLKDFTINLPNPLIIFIDDLDRCRPDYTIELLETIKHFFNVHNIIFVLALDKEQINSTIKTKFGFTNSQEYLRKFIDQDFYLPKPNSLQYINKLAEEYLREEVQRFCSNLDKLTNIVSLDVVPTLFRYYRRSLNYSNNGQYIVQFNNCLNDYRDLTDAMLHVISKYVIAFSSLYGFSLRTQEQVIIFLQMFIKTLDANNDILIPELAVALICIRFLDSNLLNRLLTNQLELEDLSNPNHIRDNFPFLNDRSNDAYMGRIESITDTEHPHNKIKPIGLWAKYLYACNNSTELDNFISSSWRYGHNEIYHYQLEMVKNIYNGIYPKIYIDKVKQLNSIMEK